MSFAEIFTQCQVLITGEYAGFDESQPTSSSGGKAKVTELLKDSSKKMVFIGDGVTDLETSSIVVTNCPAMLSNYSHRHRYVLKMGILWKPETYQLNENSRLGSIESVHE